MNIIEVTESNFEVVVKESKVPVALDFWAPWCGPCRALAPKLEKLGEEYSGKIVVAKANIDVAPKLAERFKVQGIPQVVLFVGGEECCRVVGDVSPKIIRAAFDASLKDNATPTEAQGLIDESISEYGEKVQSELEKLMGSESKYSSLAESAKPYTEKLGAEMASDREKLESGEITIADFMKHANAVTDRLKADESLKEALAAFEDLKALIADAMAKATAVADQDVG